MSAAAPSQSAMSSVLATAWPPASRISSTTICAGASDEPSPSRDVPMSLTTTRAPSAAKASACARPRPPPAPVTMTTRSSQIPMRLLSQIRLAAVGHQRGAGDVARIVTQQEGNDLADIVLEVTDASERNAADECLELRRRELRPHLEPWRHAVRNDGVDPHAVSAPFDRGRPGQRPDHLLGPGVEREAGRVRAKRRPGAEGDHAALAGHERRVRRLHAPQRAEETAVPGAPRVLLGDVEHRPEADHHRVVDQTVEPSKPFDRRRDTRVHLVPTSYVALHGQRLDTTSTHLVGGLLHLVQRPAGGDDARALSGGRERDSLTDPLTRAGDQHDLAVQPTHRGLQTAWGLSDEASGYRLPRGSALLAGGAGLPRRAARMAVAHAADTAAEAARRRLARAPCLRHRVAATAVRRRVRRHQLADRRRWSRREPDRAPAVSRGERAGGCAVRRGELRRPAARRTDAHRGGE